MTVTTPATGRRSSSPSGCRARGWSAFGCCSRPGMDANALVTSVEDPAGALAELLRAAGGSGSAHRVVAAAPIRRRGQFAAPAAPTAPAEAGEERIEAEPTAGR